MLLNAMEVRLLGYASGALMVSAGTVLLPKKTLQRAESAHTVPFLTGVSALMISWSLVFRFLYLNESFNGYVWNDEFALLVDYPAALFSGRYHSFGVLHLSFLGLLQAANTLLSPIGLSDVFCARLAMSLTSLGGAAFLYAAFRRFLPHAETSLSIAVWLLCTQHIYWSRLILGPTLMMFTVPFGAWLVCLGLESESFVGRITVSIWLGVLIFTYPGTWLTAVSVVAAILAGWYCGEANLKFSYRDIPLRTLLSLTIPAATICAFTLEAHRTYFGKGYSPLAGGGNVNFFNVPIVWSFYLFELFVEARSFFFQLPDTPLLDPPLLGFAFIGLRRMVERRDGGTTVRRSLLLAAIFLFVLLGASDRNVGIRRGLLFLIPYAVAVSNGCLELIAVLPVVRKPARVLLVALVCTSSLSLALGQVRNLPRVFAERPMAPIPQSSGDVDRWLPWAMDYWPRFFRSSTIAIP